ncbi:MAG: hypothetical protein Q8O56_02390 [Solirubrobacteraceae bacterium]|nr:hypothetical protein [Solirubrobacteraceae bacterium]
MLDGDDRDHVRCAELLRTRRDPRVVPSPVLVELDHFVPAHAFASFLDDVQRGAFVVEDLVDRDYARARALMTTYDDLRLGFVDAAVLAVVERLREHQVATLDHRHFAVVQLDHTEALELLPST